MSSSSEQVSRVQSVHEETSKPAKSLFSSAAQKVLDNAKIIVDERSHIQH